MEDSNIPLDEETLLLPTDGGEGTEPDEVAGLRAAVWQRDLDLMDARGEIAELRQSVAILTSMGAELAAALNTRDATIAGTASPVFISEVGDIGASIAALQGDVDDATAQRQEIEGRLGERDAELYRLEDQLAAAQAETEWMAAGKAELETTLQKQARGWGDVRTRLAALRAEFEPEQQEPVAGVAEALQQPGEQATAEEVPVVSPDAVLGEIATITAGVAALRLALQQKDEALAGAAARTSVIEAEPVTATMKDAELDQAKSTIASLEQQNAKLSAEVQQLQSEPEGGHLNKVVGLTAAAAGVSKLIRGDGDEEVKAAETAALDLPAEPSTAGEEQAILPDSSVADLQAELKRTKEESAKADEARAGEIAALTAAAAAAAKTLRDKDAELEEAKSAIADIEAQYAKLTAELQQLKAEPESGKMGAVAGLAVVTTGAANLLGDDSEDEAKVAGEPQEGVDQDAELASLRAELDALRLSFDAVSSERDSAQTQVQMHAAELAEAQAKPLSPEAAPDQLAPPSTAVDLAPSRVAAKTAPIQAALISGVRPQTTAIVQDLAALKGIGPVYEQRLYEGGIGTFWEVANLSNEEFLDVLKPNRAAQKQLDLEAIRADALRLARETFTMGHIWDGAAVDDLQRIEGVGQVMEQRLYDAGVRTFEQLSAITLEQLSAIVGDSELFTPDFTDWIDQARALVAQRSRP